MFDSFTLAQSFLMHLGAEAANFDNECAPIPPIPQGYAQSPDRTFSSPFYSVTAHPQFVIYNDKKVLFCQALEAPSFLKPIILETVWLHLHICILAAIDQGTFRPEALRTLPIKPCIVGLKPQMPEIFPLAHAALRFAQDNSRELENLPF